MLFRLLTAAILLAPTVWGQENERFRPENETLTKTVSWQAPFGPLSPRHADRGLIMMLITDVDPFLLIEDDQDRSPQPWCENVLAKSFRGLFLHRPDLRDRLVCQHLAAGMPANLTGGKNPGLPHRAMLAVLDSDHGLLAWMVGVPESKLLIALVEDAEEVHLMKNRFDDEQDQLRVAVMQRSTDRLDRRWAAALNEQWLVMGGSPKRHTDADQNDEWMRSRLGLLAAVFRRVYVQDVALRFGLTEKLDRTRLAILEQHPEARRSWCESMMPFVACIDFESNWRPMVESVWNFPNVSNADDASDFLTWWEERQDDESIVLALRPPLLESAKAWPPPTGDGIAAKRGLGWDSLQELLITETYRDVMAYELSYLMRDRGIESIDISSPSRVRYLYFESKKKKPVLIREGDVPGRHVAFVKRNQK